MRSTIRDVAKRAGVSLTTVSHALNGYPDVSDATRQKIMEIAKELDYAPNENGRALGGMPKKVLALMISGELYKDDPSGIVYGIMSGLYAATQENNYEFDIITVPEPKQKEISFVQVCRKKGISGIAVYGLTTDARYYKQIAKSEIPCVTVDVDVKGKNVRTVSIDNEQAAYEEVCYMIEQGYAKIGMIAGKENAQVSEKRFRGYKRALEENGMQVKPERIRYALFSEEIGREKAIELKLKYPEIDAFFCENDRSAIGAINGMLSLGYSVPEDVGIVGFDDIPVAKYVHNGLTTVTQHPYIIGNICGKTLVSLINGESIPHWVKAEYEIQKRNSANKKGNKS